jgi:hypothetical protein
MATKRELMLAGFAAKGAHMLASDQIDANGVTAAGVDQASATLLERNISMVTMTALGQGVRLPPATGQYIHFVRNVTDPAALVGPLLVYPDSSEFLNLHGPGAAWGIAPGANALFLPSRRQWAVIAGLNDATLGQVLNGPVGIGTHTPADAIPGDLFISQVLCVALGLRGAQAPPASGRMTFNAYFDPAGTWHYLGNGPAAQWRFDGGTGQLDLHTAPSGLADQTIPSWDPIPANPIVTFGQNAVGLGAPPPSDAAASSLFANYICVPWSVGVGGGQAARVNFNCYFDTALNLRYAANGPAYRIVFPSAPTGTPGMHLYSALSGTTDQPVGTLTGFFTALAPDQITTGQTNIMLTTNAAGTVVLQQVLTGPAGSGPGGTGRALYVAT